MGTSRITEEYKKITRSLSCSVSEADYLRLEPKIENIRNMAEIENRAISLYDINTGKFLLKVDRHLELLGYDNNGEIDIHDIDRYHSLVHEEDLSFLLESEIEMYRYLRPIKNNEKKDYKLVYDYRVRAVNGRYVRFLHQLMLFEIDQNFNSWILLVISDVLSTDAESQPPRRMVINTKTNKIHLFNEELKIKDYLISPREKEIMELISQGLDSSEIASRLFISVNTVNNHRQHILEKTATRNTAQAITYLKCIGLI